MKINQHSSHPSVFISSTFVDLQREREAVANVLSESNLHVNALEIKPASNNSSRQEIIAGIKESDFIILIIGNRYGSIIPKMTLSREISITRWEYIQAKHFGKDVLVYFKKVESTDPIYYDDCKSDDYETKRRFLGTFKKELSNAHDPKYFTTAEELAEKIRKAIIPAYRSGVQSLLRRNESLLKENETLKQENQRLKLAREPDKENPPNRPVTGIIAQQGLTRLSVPSVGLRKHHNISSNRPLGLSSIVTGKAPRK